MTSVRVSKDLNQGVYFITCTVKRWYYLFDRHNRWDILLDSLIYCHENKKVDFHAWVLMLNHIHLLVEAEDVSSFIRDFKRYTSKALKKNILATEPRILKLFEDEKGFKIWQPTNMPIYIESEKFYLQKMNYIEQNPVRKVYVKRPEDWVYSSANPEMTLPITRFEM